MNAKQGGLYRSDDAGATFTQASNDTRVWGRYENGPGTPLKGQTIGEDLKALFKAK